MFSLFSRKKNISPKGFTYKPRYYDEEKEEREERIRERRADATSNPEAAKARIARTFREKRGGQSKALKSAAMRSNMILLAIVIALCAFVYIFIQNHLPTLLESWFN